MNSKNMHLDTMPVISRKTRPQTAKTYMQTDIYPKIGNQPNTAKKIPKIKGMGYNCEREELYEQSMHYKKTVNQLHAELAFVKSNLVRAELENRKKEKMIEELSKDNDVEEQKEEKIKKGQESTRVALVKKKYEELKKAYSKVQEENENLKASAKITKIKEIEIETQVLSEEMQKLRKMYQHCQDQNKEKTSQLNQFDDVKSKFMQQHQIIESLQEEISTSQEENFNLKKQLGQLQDEIAKKEDTLKKQKLDNRKLKNNQSKFMDEKKRVEGYAMSYSEYQNKYAALSEQYEKLKKDYAVKEKEIYEMNKQMTAFKKAKNAPVSPYIKSFDKSKIQTVESNPKGNPDSGKIDFLTSMLKEYKAKCKIYENYLRENNLNPEEILKNKGYQGVLNSNTSKLIKSSENSKENNKETNRTNESNAEINDQNAELEKTQKNETTNNQDYNKTTCTNNVNSLSNNRISQNINNQNSVSLSKNYNNSINNNYAVEPEPIDEMEVYSYNDQAFMYLMIKNLEANNANKEELIKKTNDIYTTFAESNEESPTEEQFLSPFIDLLLEASGSNKSEKDIFIIGNALTFLLEGFGNDTTKFIDFLFNLFDQITDYKNDEKDLEQALKDHLANFKRPLCDEINTKIKLNKFIDFFELKRIYDSIIGDDNGNEFNFIVYKLKKLALKQKSDLIDLDPKYLLDLLEKTESLNSYHEIEKITENKKEEDSSVNISSIKESNNSNNKIAKKEEKKNEDICNHSANLQELNNKIVFENDENPMKADENAPNAEEQNSINDNKPVSEIKKISEKDLQKILGKINKEKNEKYIEDSKFEYSGKYMKINAFYKLFKEIGINLTTNDKEGLLSKYKHNKSEFDFAEFKKDLYENDNMGSEL